MKTRTGFVSNSSSSSFVLIIATALYHEVCEELDFNKYQQSYLDSLCKENVFNGVSVNTFHHIGDSGGVDNWHTDNPNFDDENIMSYGISNGQDVWQRFLNTVRSEYKDSPQVLELDERLR